MDYYNKERISPVFKKPPFKVTRDDVEDRSEKLYASNNLVPTPKQ